MATRWSLEDALPLPPNGTALPRLRAPITGTAYAYGRETAQVGMHRGPEHDFDRPLRACGRPVPADHRERVFQRVFCDHELVDQCGDRTSCRSITREKTVGAVRGLHFQAPPHAEMKLVRCLRGRVWDVAVDLRPDSPTFLQWHAEELSFDNGRMLVVPEGCAHGFQVLEAKANCSTCIPPLRPAAEGAARYDDLPSDRLAAPVAVSERDHSTPSFERVSWDTRMKCRHCQSALEAGLSRSRLAPPSNGIPHEQSDLGRPRPIIP